MYYARGPNSSGLWRVRLVDGTEELVVPDLKPGYWGCWGVANDGIYFIEPGETSGAEIRAFHPGTGRVTTVASIGKPPFSDSGFAVSRDGKSFLFTQTDHSGSDIMLINNFR